MRNAPDASFLLRLYIPRSGSVRAAAIMETLRDPLLITPLLAFEVENAIRHAAWLREQDRTKGITMEFAASALAAFESDLERKRVQIEDCDLLALVKLAREISHRRTWAFGCHPMDIMYVGGALLLKADRFLTLDVVQQKLAEAEGLRVSW